MVMVDPELYFTLFFPHLQRRPNLVQERTRCEMTTMYRFKFGNQLGPELVY